MLYGSLVQKSRLKVFNVPVTGGIEGKHPGNGLVPLNMFIEDGQVSSNPRFSYTRQKRKLDPASFKKSQKIQLVRLNC